MNNTSLLFYSPKPQSQVRILAGAYDISISKLVCYDKSYGSLFIYVFEERALADATYSPLIWWRYINDNILQSNSLARFLKLKSLSLMSTF